MTAVTIVEARAPGVVDSVRRLIDEYAASLDVSLCFQDLAHELEHLREVYAPPRGELLLARRDGVDLGCVAFRPFAPDTCEMKRLYVRPSARGLGLGRSLVTRILDDAKAIGYSEVVLDTLPSMIEAQRLYEQFGFRDIDPYRPNPIVGSRYLGKSL